MEYRKKSKKSNSAWDEFRSRGARSALAESNSLFSFLRSTLEDSRLFALWQRFLKYFRRFRFATTLMRLLPWILFLASTHTLLYAVVAVAFIGIPFLITAIATLWISVVLRHKSTNRAFASLLTQKTVLVFFPQRNGEFGRSDFWRANLLSLSQNDDVIIIIVSPFVFSPCGLFDGRFYYNARAEKRNVFLVRRHYFFSLRKHVLLPLVKRLIFIY